MYGLSASVFAVIGVACFMIVGKDIRRFSKISLVALRVGFAFIPLALISAGSFGHKLGSVSNQPTINQIELRQIGDRAVLLAEALREHPAPVQEVDLAAAIELFADRSPHLGDLGQGLRRRGGVGQRSV